MPTNPGHIALCSFGKLLASEAAGAAAAAGAEAFLAGDFLAVDLLIGDDPRIESRMADSSTVLRIDRGGGPMGRGTVREGHEVGEGAQQHQQIAHLRDPVPHPEPTGQHGLLLR